MKMVKDIPDDVDELIDDLPLHVRNKVLQQYGEEEPEHSGWSRFSRGKKIAWWLMLIPASVWCGVVGLAGFVLLVIMPLAAIPILAIAGIPLGVLIMWRIEGPRKNEPEEGQEDE